MMADHWLTGLLDLFTCPSDDLVDLARVAGYDPRVFYRGTLTEDQIDQLTGALPEPTQDEGLIHIDGDLGMAAAWLPRKTPVLEAPVVLFANEMALLEACFGGRFEHDCAAVLLSPLFPEDGVAMLTPALEHLNALGQTVMLIVDGPFENLSAAVPVVSNFAETHSRDGAIARLSDGDLVRIDVSQGHLTVKKQSGKRRAVPDMLSIVIDRMPKLGDPNSDLVDSLPDHLALLEELSAFAGRLRRRGEASTYLRAMLTVALNLDRLLIEASLRDVLHRFNAYPMEIQSIAERLRRGASIARRHGLIHIAFRLCKTLLQLLNTLGEPLGGVLLLEAAATHHTLGDLHKTSASPHQARSEYLVGLELIRQKARTVDTPQTSRLSAELLHKLSAITAQDHLSLDTDETHFLREALRYIGLADPFLSDRPFLELKAEIHLSNALLDYQLGNLAPALSACRDAISSLHAIRRDRYSTKLAEKLVAAYRLESDAFWAADRIEESVIARVASLHFGLHILEGTNSKRRGEAGLKELAENLSRLQLCLHTASTQDRFHRSPHNILAIASNNVGDFTIDLNILRERDWITRIHHLRASLWDHMPKEIRQAGLFP